MTEIDLTALRAEFCRPEHMHSNENRVIAALLDRVEKAEAELAFRDARECLPLEERAIIAEENERITASFLATETERNERLRALLARAGEALRPFGKARIGASWRDHEAQGSLDTFDLTVGDLRTARAIAREIEEAIGHE